MNIPQLIKESKYTVVFTGAGMSTESGLPRLPLERKRPLDKKRPE